MSFSSALFLFLFLPVALPLCLIAPRGGRGLALLLSGLAFCLVGQPALLWLLPLSTLSAYLHARAMERFPARARAALISSLVFGLALLVFFKYTDFLITTWNGVLGARVPLLGLALPVGVSFFTFESMAYVIDVYRGESPAERSFFRLLTFTCFFPKLTAGPITRYGQLAPALRRGAGFDLTRAASGASRFVTGLSKKLLLADPLGGVTAAFRAAEQPTVLFHWLYAVAFSLQIYFDFSGYSDMALGLARMLGFDLPENFDHPFCARSVTEFWRRWHMTLGRWFRDYVYIPLGGNRVSRPKWLRNLLIVWLLTGFWHGAAWSFALWGLYFGALLALEKLWLGRRLERCPRPVQHLYLLVAVVVSFVLFGGAGLDGTLGDLAGLLGLGGLPLSGFETVYTLKSYAVLLVVAAVGATPLPRQAAVRLLRRPDGRATPRALLEPVGAAALLLVCAAFLVDGSFSPFLYFRF